MPSLFCFSRFGNGKPTDWLTLSRNNCFMVIWFAHARSLARSCAHLGKFKKMWCDLIPYNLIECLWLLWTDGLIWLEFKVVTVTSASSSSSNQRLVFFFGWKFSWDWMLVYSFYFTFISFRVDQTILLSSRLFVWFHLYPITQRFFS